VFLKEEAHTEERKKAPGIFAEQKFRFPWH